MNKKIWITSLFLAAFFAVAANANSVRVLRVTMNDGSTKLFMAKLVSKITFDAVAASSSSSVASSSSEKATSSSSGIKNIEFVSVPKDNESVTVSVAAGAMEGDNTFLLKDVKSMDFIDMDESLDTDGDGFTDVQELFIYGSDPKKKTHKSNNLVELGYYNAKLVKFGSVDFSQNPVAVRIDSLVRGPVILKFRTEEPVDAVFVSYNDSLVALF